VNRAVRRESRKQRRVFRPKRQVPLGMVLRQVVLSLLLLAGGVGVVVLLQRLPEQVDLVVLVSKAINELISGIQLLLSAMVGLGVVMLIAALVILGGVLMLGGLWRLVRLLRLLLFPNSLQGRR